MKALESGSKPFEVEISLATDQVNDRILTGLRTIWGLSLLELDEEFQVDLWEIKSAAIEKLAQQGWLKWDDKTLSLTKKGMLLADSIAAELFI